MEIRELNEELSKYIKEDLTDAIVDASANIGQQEMVDILFGVIARYVPQDTLERIKTSFEFELVKDKNESVNETKDVDGDIVDYNFLVTVTMDAENEVANDSLKADIQKAIEDGLEKYDAAIEVEDA